jgi:predicted integral membrane protein DUF2269
MSFLLAPLLVLHVLLAVGLFLPSLLLPFALRRRSSQNGDRGRMVTALLWLQRTGSLVIGLGLALTGAGLVAILGPSLLGQPWLIVALVIYAANLAVAFFIQRPNLRRLFLPSDAATERGADDDARWRARARRQRYVSYGMAAAVGLIGFLMSAKPRLW